MFKFALAYWLWHYFCPNNFVYFLFACSLRSFAHVAHFVRSSLAHSLRSFAALSLTHFIRSLLALTSLALLLLTSFTPRLLTHFVRSLHFCPLTSFVRTFVTHFVRSSLAHSLRSFALGARFAHALPPYDLVFRFTLYNLSGGGCPLKSPIACTITFYNLLVPSLCPYCRKKAPILVHLDCPIACTITFLYLLVQSLVLSLFQFVCAISLFQKIFP